MSPAVQRLLGPLRPTPSRRRPLLLSAGHAVNDALNGLADASGVSPRVARHPWGSLVAALGAGYVVGGGLFTPTTARILKLALRLAAIPLVRGRLLDAAETTLDGVLGTPTPSSKEETPCGVEP